MSTRLPIATAVALLALSAPAANATVLQGPPSAGTAAQSEPATGWGETTLGVAAGLLVVVGLLASRRVGRIQRADARSLPTG